jgi:hypothetical protein
LRKTTLTLVSAPTALAAMITAAPVGAGEQDAIDGCIDQLRKVGGRTHAPAGRC